MKRIVATAAPLVLACGVLGFAIGSQSQSPLPACSPALERTYEITRFARHSHLPWLNRALRDEVGATVDDDAADPEFQRWWIDRYDEVLVTLATVCRPSPSFPNLDDLPGQWENYPARPSAGTGA